MQGRDLAELVLLPGIAAVLPWRWCFRVFRAIAHWRWPYREACEEALAQARARGWAGEDEAAWLHARRLVTLVDHADLFLAFTRSDRYLRHHLRVDGQWPQEVGPAVLCTFHWGAGMWGLRHARAHGMRAHALIAPLRREHFMGRPIPFHVFSRRNVAVQRALGQAPLDVSTSLRPALKALRAGDQVLAAIDVPADQVAASTEIAFLGHRARVPRALLRVAVEQGLPVVLYLTGLDRRSGERTLRIRTLPPQQDVDELTQAVFAELEAAVRHDPAAWHFWSVAQRFFVRDGT